MQQQQWEAVCCVQLCGPLCCCAHAFAARAVTLCSAPELILKPERTPTDRYIAGSIMQWLLCSTSGRRQQSCQPGAAVPSSAPRRRAAWWTSR